MSDANCLRYEESGIKCWLALKYAGTHTRGKVKEIRVAGDSTWVLIDSTNLYYDPKH